MNNYKKLENAYLKIAHLDNLLSILHWDVAVNLSIGSAESRTEEMMTLSSIIHSMVKSNNLKDLVYAAKEEINNLNEWEIANILEIEKKIRNASCIDDELQKKIVSATSRGELIWREAKATNDYNLFKPYFQQILNYTRELAKARAATFNSTPYDSLIDLYDPGRKSSEIREVFSVLKKNIPILVAKIVEKQKSEKTSIADGNLSAEVQKKIGKRLMEIMGFNFSKGRLDESVHPFCGGTANDVRITNRYDENNFISGIMGVIHETGHALYEQNLPSLYKNQPVGNAKGMAFHESQSLFMEMQIGRSKEFMEFFSKLLREEFGIFGDEYLVKNLYKKVTQVTPSLIRVDADEVTYSMHVILRFELEELLINDDIKLDELPKLWQEKMQEYLNIKPINDSTGCLQDIHWPSGMFGYFPAYTNGAIIASMLMKRADRVGVFSKQDLVKGEFTSVNKFLNSNLRSLGSLKNSDCLLKEATGEEKIRPDIFLEYLERKYL